MLEILQQIIGGLITLLSVLLKRSGDYRLQRVWYVRIQIVRRCWCSIENRVVDYRHGLARKSPLAGRHLVQDQSEGEKVGARVQLLLSHLLRGHIAGGPCSRSRASQTCRNLLAMFLVSG